MSNAKQIQIVAELPWAWAETLSEEDAARFAGLFLNPVVGVELTQESIGYKPNENGGQTAMYRVTISGREALSCKYLDALVDAIGGVPEGKLIQAQAQDIEDTSVTGFPEPPFELGSAVKQ